MPRPLRTSEGAVMILLLGALGAFIAWATRPPFNFEQPTLARLIDALGTPPNDPENSFGSDDALPYVWRLMTGGVLGVAAAGALWWYLDYRAS